LAAGLRPRSRSRIASREVASWPGWRRSEGTADRFRSTQRGYRLVCCSRVDQVDESSVASVEQRHDADELVVSAIFNARAETVAEKPTFQDARAPALHHSGERVFRGDGRGGRQAAALFTAADGSPILAFAGLWDRWIDPASKEEILSCAVIVSGASAWMTPYHDRMPALLRGPDFDAWLDGSPGADALRPAATEGALREWPAARRVNGAGVGDDDPTIIERVDVGLRPPRKGLRHEFPVVAN
jgi:putative SOS response-associated peptidase YedK